MLNVQAECKNNGGGGGPGGTGEGETATASADWRMKENRPNIDGNVYEMVELI